MATVRLVLALSCCSSRSLLPLLFLVGAFVKEEREHGDLCFNDGLGMIVSIIKTVLPPYGSKP
jgi:hypothetical protein